MYPKFKVRTEGQSVEGGVHEYSWSSMFSLKDVPFLLHQDSCFPVKDHGDISAHCVARIPKSYVPNSFLPTNIVLPAESASKVLENKNNSNEEDRPNKQSDKKSTSKEEDRPRVGSDKKTKFNKENTPNIRSRKKTKLNEEDGHNIRSDKKSNSGEEDRPNIRASSVPRPRAVLSSPDNDAVIRNKSRVKALRSSPLKTHSAVKSRQTQSTTIHGKAIDDKSSPLKTHSAVKSRQTQSKTIHGKAIDDMSSRSLRKPKDKTDTGVDLRAKKWSATSIPHKSVTPTKHVQF